MPAVANNRGCDHKTAYYAGAGRGDLRVLAHLAERRTAGPGRFPRSAIALDSRAGHRQPADAGNRRATIRSQL